MTSQLSVAATRAHDLERYRRAAEARRAADAGRERRHFPRPTLSVVRLWLGRNPHPETVQA